MLRELWKELSDNERAEFMSSAGITAGMMKKYTRNNPNERPKPGTTRFERLLSAANKLRPGAITREQLAAYFYAAPAKTGTGQKAEAA